MKFEDDNFEEEFLDWLNSKTKEEIIEGLKGVTMEIEIGDFVRIKSGIIGKVEQIGNSLFWLEDGSSYSLSDKTIKHSKNIIDLIEVGDYVNGLYIDLLEKDKIWATSMYGDEDIVFYENEIKTILTHEQYQENCYTVERKSKE